MTAPLSLRFGLALRSLRLARGVSQTLLAEACGIDPTYVSTLERGTRNPSLETVERLAHALGVPAWRLVQEAEESEQAWDPRSAPKRPRRSSRG